MDWFVPDDVLFVHTAALGCHADKLFVVKFDPQFFGKHFAKQMASTAVFAGNGDDGMLVLLQGDVLPERRVGDPFVQKIVIRG